MGIATETAASNLQASLAAGITTISANQQVTFIQYTKTVLSQDGFVFWVKSGTSKSYAGSLHFASETHQDEDQTIAINNVIFTAKEEITEFNSINPQTIWIGTFATPGGNTILIAFNQRGRFYQQAGVWHYSGDAVYPALQAQLVNTSADLPVGPIVSNSLPIWLAQNQTYPVYASFLVPDNVVPPYIVAHIDPADTDAIGAFPIYSWPGTPIPPTNLQQMPSSQLLRDKVRLTLYGLNSQQATQFYVSLLEYSEDTDSFGFCNSPVIRDEKRTQSEITAIAMKKTMEIEASYYLDTADAIARRLILSAAVTTTA